MTVKADEIGIGWRVSDLIVMASFAALSTRSLPGKLECPGTHCMKTVDEMEDIL